MTDIDIAKPGPLMAGKRGLVMGVANEQIDRLGHRARSCRPRRRSSPSRIRATLSAAAPFRLLNRSAPKSSCHAMSLDLNSVDNVFTRIKEEWGGLDFVVHALAFSDRRELAGRYADTTRDNFTNTMVISCFSFTEIAKRAADLMPNGGSLITLSYGGATRWVPSYNVMGVAKAALEASVRYLAADLGPQGVRVNALSAGVMRTLAGAGVSDARVIFNYQRDHAPLEAHADARRESAARRSTCCRRCPAPSPAKCISSTAAITPSSCRRCETLKEHGRRRPSAEPARRPKRRSDNCWGVDAGEPASQTLRP